MEELKVSAKSNPNAVAGAMAAVLRRATAVGVTVIGAGALNQAMKAIAIVRGHVADDGLEAVCVPSFVEIDVEGEHRTALRLVVEHRRTSVLDVRERAVAAGT